MKNFTINYCSTKTNVHFGNYINVLKKTLKNKRFIIICDKNIFLLYPEIEKLSSVICINAGEKQKSLNTVEYLYSELIKLNADRTTNIVTIGGGITCDIAGYVASTFYRGLPFILIPTSLLAMTDAAIGGKNGVNYKNHKNIIGIISQPENIIIDKSFLKTLPEEEYRNGIAEIIKHAIISGDLLFNKLKNNKSQKINDEILRLSIQTKVKFVTADEKENGIRRILNFGHTFGHIIEISKNLKHGEAVGIGMVLASKISENLNKCNAATTDKTIKMLEYYNLPTTCKLDFKNLEKLLTYDKKNDNKYLHFVFIEKIGKVVVERISRKTIIRVLSKVISYPVKRQG